MKKLALIPTLIACATAHAQLYHVTDLGTFVGAQSQGYGINNLGQAVGEAFTAHAEHGFLFSNGVMVDVTPTTSTAVGTAINSSGQIVGYAVLGGNTYIHAFLLTNGTTQDLGTVDGDTTSVAWGINDAGQVTGVSSTMGDYQHAFVYSSAGIQDIGSFDGQGAGAYGINSTGQVVGSSDAGSSVDLFLYLAGEMQDLGSFGGTYAEGVGINNSGQITGVYQQSGTGYTGSFLYSNGSFQDIGSLGGNNIQACGINSVGQVVGNGYTADDREHGFLFSGGVMSDLNTLLDSSGAGVVVKNANCINNSGVIVGWGSTLAGSTHALVLTPVATNAVLPSSYSILIGTQSSGSLYSIQFNDAWYLNVQAGTTTLLSEAPIQVQLSGTAPTVSPSNFQFTFTGHVNSINLSQSILLYNFNTNAYETLNTSAAHAGSDSTVTVTPSGDLTRFVNQSTGEVRARVNFSRAGRTSVLLWSASLGVASWIIQ